MNMINFVLFAIYCYEEMNGVFYMGRTLSNNWDVTHVSNALSR
jgi:hypothetical protein